MFEEQALAFTKRLEQLYFVERDMDAILQFLHKDITWIGIGAEEVCKGIAQAESLLKAEQAGFYNNFTIEDQWLEAFSLSDTQCMVFGEIKVKENAPHAVVMELHLRISLICLKALEELKVFHIHFSTPNAEQEPGEFFPKERMKQNNRMLQELVGQQSKELRRRNQDLELLAANIPGGVQCCRNDEEFTILQLGSGFFSMIGYSEKEIREQFGNKASRLVLKEDREASVDAIKKQLLEKKSFEAEYRIQCKDGSHIWVLDKGQMVQNEDGQEFVYSVMVDITNAKHAQEELRLTLERHQIIMNQTNDIIFEWDIMRDALSLSANWEKTFGYQPKKSELALSLNVHPEDDGVLMELRRKARAGQAYVDAEVRIRKQDDTYMWCKVRASVVFDTAGRPYRCVGVIIDIDGEKKESQRLLEKAERDALTGLYNKMALQTQVEATLKHSMPGQCHALLMIDIDNFKMVNDTQGHLFGDAVLSDAARSLQNIFRSSDLIGRIGGDEFIVFMRGISEKRLARRKAEEIIQMVSHIISAENIECGISCSVGIALCPADGCTYQDLYKKADQALYHVKKKGKNGCEFYKERFGTEQLAVRLGEARSSVNEKIDSEETSRVLNDKLVEYVFRMLYKSIDTNTAVNLILEIVGRHFDVSRVYIFESTEDGEYCDNTFEWCNDGVLPEIDKLRHLSYKEDLADYQTNFDEDGVFYCRDIQSLHQKLYDILAPQGIASILQCAIKDGEQFKGYVGFDECRTNRFWTKEQVEALSFISEILSTFLVKQRAQERLAQTLQLLSTVVDNQSSWIYVVEKATLRLLFANKKTLALAPGTRMGMTCHQAFFGSSRPCAACPVRELEKGRCVVDMEVDNPNLNVWSRVETSTIQWDKEQEAYLICCYDITKYKKDESQSSGRA